MKHTDFIVPPGKRLRLKDYDPAATGKFTREAEAMENIRKDCAELARLQDMLMARESYSLLLIFQAMDGSAKDGTIRHVMSAADPQGCRVAQFQQPSKEELRHNYLWRFIGELPRRGEIGIFNRSYYEEVLVTRVHPEQLAEQHLPRSTARAKLWKQRFNEINNFERYLVDNGTVVMKFFLHLSKEKQRERLLERITEREKRWKFSLDDIEERGYWNDYMRAYEDALTHTSTIHAPWHIIPADHRWFTALAVGALVVEKLKSLKLSYPENSSEDKREVLKAKKRLEAER